MSKARRNRRLKQDAKNLKNIAKMGKKASKKAEKLARKFDRKAKAEEPQKPKQTGPPEKVVFSRTKYHTNSDPRLYHQIDYARRAEIALQKGWGIIGALDPYYPFHPIHRVALSGWSGRPVCPKTGWVIHCHSKGEINWARLLLWDDNHHRLYSQVALQRQITKRISDELGILHPRYPDGSPTVMTADFVHQTEVNGELAYTAYAIKDHPDNLSKRDWDKLKIEKAYFEDQGIPWLLKFRDEANQVKLANIRFICGHEGVSPTVWGSKDWKQYEPTLYAKISSGMAVNHACRATEAELGMLKNSALTLVRFFIASRIWLIDWNVRYNPLSSLAILGRRPDIQL